MNLHACSLAQNKARHSARFWIVGEGGVEHKRTASQTSYERAQVWINTAINRVDNIDMMLFHECRNPKCSSKELHGADDLFGLPRQGQFAITHLHRKYLQAWYLLQLLIHFATWLADHIQIEFTWIEAAQ